MWFEELGAEVELRPDTPAYQAIYTILYYLFTAHSVMAIIWILWRVIEKTEARLLNLGVVAVGLGIVFLVLEGLRHLKLWARYAALAELGALGLSCVYLLAKPLQQAIAEPTPDPIIAICIYLLFLGLSGFGLRLFFTPAAKKIPWS